MFRWMKLVTLIDDFTVFVYFSPLHVHESLHLEHPALSSLELCEVFGTL